MTSHQQQATSADRCFTSHVGVRDVTCVCRNDFEVSRVGVRDVTCVCAEMTLRCRVLVYTM